MRYLRRTSSYPERITLSDPTHVMSMNNIAAFSLETPVIDSVSSVEKEFTKLI